MVPLDHVGILQVRDGTADLEHAVIVASSEVHLACRGADKRLGVSRPHIGVARQAGAGIRVSTDGRGHALDYNFVERFWRSLQCEEAYSRGCATIPELGAALRRYCALHTVERAHQSLNRTVPGKVRQGRPTLAC